MAHNKTSAFSFLRHKLAGKTALIFTDKVIFKKTTMKTI